MSITQAQGLLELSNSNLEDLLDCLISLSKDCGYIEAVKKFGWRNSESSDESLSEFYLYIYQIKNRIKNHAQTNI